MLEAGIFSFNKLYKIEAKQEVWWVLQSSLQLRLYFQNKSPSTQWATLSTWTGTHCLLSWLHTLIALDRSQLTCQFYFGGILSYTEETDWVDVKQSLCPRPSGRHKILRVVHRNPNENNSSCEIKPYWKEEELLTQSFWNLFCSVYKPPHSFGFLPAAISQFCK